MLEFYIDNDKLKRAEFHQAGITGIDMRKLNIKGDILDLGAGGEGIIAQLFGNQVIGIAPEAHSGGLVSAPECRLKIMMDARDLKFVDNSFCSVTIFYTLMYIDFSDYEKVFNEVYRVLKPGGSFYIWDLEIPKSTGTSAKFYLNFFEILLPDKTVKTGYAAKWGEKFQNLKTLRELALKIGFDVVKEKSSNGNLFLMLKK